MPLELTLTAMLALQSAASTAELQVDVDQDFTSQKKLLHQIA